MNFKQHIINQIDRNYYITPSACALIFFHLGGTGKFVELRAEAEQVIAIEKQFKTTKR